MNSCSDKSRRIARNPRQRLTSAVPHGPLLWEEPLTARVQAAEGDLRGTDITAFPLATGTRPMRSPLVMTRLSAPSTASATPISAAMMRAHEFFYGGAKW